jgi:hypothetical protein
MNDKPKKLYDKLSKSGFKLPDYDTFYTGMQDKETAEKIYGKLGKAGYKLPDFEKFYSTFTQEPTEQPVEQVATEEAEQPTQTLQQETPQTGVRTGQFGNVGLEIPIQETDSKELSHYKSVRNTFNNAWQQIKAVPQDFILGNMAPMAMVDKSIKNVGESIGLPEKAIDAFRAGYSFLSWAPQLVTTGTVSPTVSEAQGRMAEISASKKEDMQVTKEFVQSIREGDIGGVAAGAINGAIGYLPSIVVGAATKGGGFIPYFAGTEIAESSREKADMITDGDIRELFINEDADIVVPAITGGIAGYLEKLGLGMTKKFIEAPLKKGFVKGMRDLGATTGVQGVVNWLEGGLSQFNLEYARTGKLDESGLKMTDWLFSEEGANAALEAASGTALMGGGGRVFRRALSTKDGNETFVGDENGAVHERGRMTEKEAEEKVKDLKERHPNTEFTTKNITDESDPFAEANFTIEAKPKSKPTPVYTQNEETADKKSIEEAIENAETIEDLEGIGIENDSELESKLSNKFKEISDKTKSELQELDATTEQEQPAEQQPTTEESVVVEDVQQEPTDKGTDTEVSVEEKLPSSIPVTPSVLINKKAADGWLRGSLQNFEDPNIRMRKLSEIEEVVNKDKRLSKKDLQLSIEAIQKERDKLTKQDAKPVTKETPVADVSRDTRIEGKSESVGTEKSDLTVNDSRPRVTFEFLGEEMTGTKDGEIIIGDDGTKYREANVSNLKEIPAKDRLSKQKEAVKKAFDEVKKTFNEGNNQGIIYDFEKVAKDNLRFHNALRNLVVEYARLKGMQFDQAINELSKIFKRPITKKNKDYIKTIWDEVTAEKPTATEGKPSTEKDTLVNEYQELKKSLKEQVKAAKEGFKQGKKEATGKAKEKADKLTAIRNVITKFVNDDLADIKIDKLTRGEVKRIVSALNTVKTETSMNRAIDKIFDLIAKSANSSRVNKAKANQKTARKNVKSGKIGLTDHNGAIDTLLKIDPNMVPRDVFERFEAIIDNLSKRNSVLKPIEKNSLIDESNEILKKVEEQNTKVDELRQAYEEAEKVKGIKTVDGKKVKYDSYSKTVDKMLKDGVINEDDARLMRDRRNDIIEKETEVSDEVDVEAAKAELIDEILDKNNSLPERNPLFNSDETKILNFFNSLTKEDLENLSLSDLKRLNGLKENLRNNYVPHLAEKYRAKIEGVRAAKPLLPILGNFKGGVLNLWNFISGAKAKVKNWGKRGSTSTMQEKIRRNPTLYIDQVIGNFKNTVLYDNTFRKLSEGHSGYSFLVEKLKTKLSIADRKLKKPFESRAKISLIRLQEQFESNDGQNTAKEWLDATLKDRNSIYDSEAKAELQRIFDRYTNSEGEFDVKKAKKTLSPEEKNAYDTLKEHFEALRDKADFTATTIRGNRVPMFENYHPVYRAVLGSDKSMELDKLQAMSKPSTKAGTLTDRTGSAHAISFDPFEVAMLNAKDVLLDYYMTPAMNEVNSTMDALQKAAETEHQANAVTALRRVINEVTENVIGVNFGSSNIADTIINELTRKGYQATLSGVGRSAAELTSNIVFSAVYKSTEFTNGAKMLWKNRGDMATIAGVIENVPTTQKNRLLDYGGMDSKHIDYSRSGNEMRKVLSPDSKTKEVLNKAGSYYRAVDRWAANIVSKPDQMIAKPLWFGGFEQEFTNITGRKPDLKKIAENDQNYLEENRKAIEQATKFADGLVTEAVSSQNPFDSIPKNQVRPSKYWIVNFYRSFNSYMSNFRIFEHNSAVRGISSLVTNGVLTKEQGAKLLAAASARITTYSLMMSVVVPMVEKAIVRLFGYELEDEEEKNEVGNILAREFFSTVAMLAINRNIGNWGNIPLNFAIEYLNKTYGEGITYSDKYDPYEDNLVFPLVPLERQGYGKDIATTAALNALGPYSPIAKTLYNGSTYYQRMIDAKTEETRDKNRDKLFYKTSFEMAGNLGLIPLYRDFRRVMNTIMYETKQKAIDASKNNEDTDELDFDFDMPSFDEENINFDEIEFDNLDL